MVTITNLDDSSKEVNITQRDSSQQATTTVVLSSFSHSHHHEDDEDEFVPNPELPQEFRERIVDRWDGSKLQLFFTKRLEAGDVTKDQNRITIPVSQLAAAGNDGLITDEELGTARALKVRVIGPCLQRTWMLLECVDIEGSSSYRFYCSHWYNSLVLFGNLGAGSVIHVWFYRGRDLRPCFAFVRGDEPRPGSALASVDR